MGENKWSSQRKAARSARKHMEAMYEREYMLDPEEVEKDFNGSENYKGNKHVK